MHHLSLADAQSIATFRLIGMDVIGLGDMAASNSGKLIKQLEKNLAFQAVVFV